MSVPGSGAPPPVVESKPAGDRPEVTLRALQTRVRQQELLAELGVVALQGASLGELLNHAARTAAEGLGAEYCKVLEHIPSENRLLVRAGVGWDAGVVGVASVGADLESPSGFALRTGKPVLSNHLENEERFRTPEMLRQYGIRRAMNVILQGDGKPFGVLEVDSKSENDFEEHDLSFLQGAANVLGMAIERERHERSIKAALLRDQLLLKEMNHRVKNSLAMVASMLNLQSREVKDPELTAHLTEASRRVAAVAKAHDQLGQGSRFERLDIGKYVTVVCADIDSSVARCEVDCNAESGIEIETQRAIPIALIVNELITNAAKYAYQDRAGGKVWVRIVSGADKRRFIIYVRDEGKGLPPDFDPRRAKGLGMRIVASFASQLKANMIVHRRSPGTEFELSIPVDAK